MCIAFRRSVAHQTGRVRRVRPLAENAISRARVRELRLHVFTFAPALPKTLPNPRRHSAPAPSDRHDWRPATMRKPARAHSHRSSRRSPTTLAAHRCRRTSREHTARHRGTGWPPTTKRRGRPWPRGALTPSLRVTGSKRGLRNRGAELLLVMSQTALKGAAAGRLVDSAGMSKTSFPRREGTRRGGYVRVWEKRDLARGLSLSGSGENRGAVTFLSAQVMPGAR